MTNPVLGKPQKKTVLLFAVCAAVIFLIIAARTIVRASKLLLFRYNLGFSLEDAGLLYDYQTAIIAIVSLLVFLTAYLIYMREIKYETLFALLAFSFGMLFMFTITPLSVPDEYTHFEAIFELSNKLFGSAGDNSLMDFSGYYGQNNVCTAYLRIIRDLFAPATVTQPRESNVLSDMWTLTYAAEYIPQVIGFSLARLLNFGSVTVFMSARFFNLLFYVTCLYFAVKLTPRFKLVLGLSGLMPMAMQQAASLSYDTFINALSFLLLALLLRAVFDDQISSNTKSRRVTFILIFIIAAFLTPAKVIYAFIILLFVFIPKDRFSGKLKKWPMFALLVAVCIAAFAAISLPTLIRIMNSTPPSYGEDGGTQYTLAYFFTNPSDALGIFQDSFNVSFSTWLTQAVGQSLSTCNLDLPTWIVPVYLVLLLMTSNMEDEDFRLPRGMRSVLIFLVFATILAFMMTMFLTWIKNTDKIIFGVQGRYFIPIIPLAVIALNSKAVTVKNSSARGICMTATLLLARTILAILDYTMFNV